jgi:hypothetical protein
MAASPMTREEAESYYDNKLRETYPDDAVLAARIQRIEQEDAAQASRHER